MTNDEEDEYEYGFNKLYHSEQEKEGKNGIIVKDANGDTELW